MSRTNSFKILVLFYCLSAENGECWVLSVWLPSARNGIFGCAHYAKRKSLAASPWAIVSLLKKKTMKKVKTRKREKNRWTFNLPPNFLFSSRARAIRRSLTHVPVNSRRLPQHVNSHVPYFNIPSMRSHQLLIEFEDIAGVKLVFRVFVLFFARNRSQLTVEGIRATRARRVCGLPAIKISLIGSTSTCADRIGFPQKALSPKQNAKSVAFRMRKRREMNRSQPTLLKLWNSSREFITEQGQWDGTESLKYEMTSVCLRSRSWLFPATGFYSNCIRCSLFRDKDFWRRFSSPRSVILRRGKPTPEQLESEALFTIVPTPTVMFPPKRLRAWNVPRNWNSILSVFPVGEALLTVCDCSIHRYFSFGFFVKKALNVLARSRHKHSALGVYKTH